MLAYTLTFNVSADQAEGLRGDIFATLVGADGQRTDDLALTWPAELDADKAIVAGSAIPLTLLFSEVGKVSQIIIRLVSLVETRVDE